KINRMCEYRFWVCNNTPLLSKSQKKKTTPLIYYSLLLIGLRIEPANLNTSDTCINISKQEDDRHNQMDLIRSGT
ncbi:hypothetical protein PSY31_23830, partial [Shigella flexneri]|nr:hypothetical protein [Shigella flexneri]